LLLASSSSFDTLQVAIIIFAVFSMLQDVNIPPHSVVVCLLLLLLLNIVVLSISAVAPTPKL
jgi:hypothetical protein